MAKNLSLEALKMHLMETIEGVKNLSDEEADPQEKTTVEQAKAIVAASGAFIDICKLQVEAVKAFAAMDNIAAPGTLLESVGIINNDEHRLIGG